MEKELDVIHKTENALTDRQTDRQVIIVGAIGNTERHDRDAARVISGKGLIYTLTAHIHKEYPLILKRFVL